MEQPKQTLQEQIMQRTIIKQGNRIAELATNLDMAHAQIDILNEQLKEQQENNKSEE